MREEILRFEKVTKRYGSVVALDSIDLTVHKGEFLTLLGPSGSGKTTLLNVIAGTVLPSEGKLRLSGRDITTLPSNQRQLGMVFQNYALFPHMTIFENVAFPLRVRRISEAEIKRRVSDVLTLVQLSHVTDRKPRELSGGQQQRIAIARCLVYNPDLILMDEPLGALDKKLRDQMQLEIKKLHSKLGVTILYVTHDQEEALVMSDRICLMNGGRIEQLGKPHELYFNPASVFAADFLGESNILEAEVKEGPGQSMLSSLSSLTLDRPDVQTETGRCKVMIRPENLKILDDGEHAPNTLSGLVEDIIFVGGITRVRIRLPDGGVLTTKQFTTPEHLAKAPGEPVLIGWKPSDVVLLPT